MTRCEKKTGIDFAHDALDRLQRALERNTGCHLTADMVFGLHVSFLGEAMASERPNPNDEALS